MSPLPDPAGPRIAVMRSALGRARGLGASHGGSHHWWLQRLGSLALLPLTLWFVVTLLRLGGGSRLAAQAYFRLPWNATLLIAFILATFHHAALGLQVVIEDYLRGPTRLAALLAMRGGLFLLALACLLASLRLAL